MKKIKDITLAEIKEGKNWKVNPPKDFNIPLEEWEIESVVFFNLHDNVAYSAIFCADDGKIFPLILIKEVGGLDYGGDYCEYKDGRWRQVGLEPDPNASRGKEFIANPLPNDPSFDAVDDFRKEHHKNFNVWSQKL